MQHCIYYFFNFYQGICLFQRTPLFWSLQSIIKKVFIKSRSCLLPVKGLIVKRLIYSNYYCVCIESGRQSLLTIAKIMESWDIIWQHTEHTFVTVLSSCLYTLEPTKYQNIILAFLFKICQPTSQSFPTVNKKLVSVSQKGSLCSVSILSFWV